MFYYILAASHIVINESNVFLGADCHRFQFECINKDDPSLSECIAVYDRCNTIRQCRDGSDETDCHADSDSVEENGPVSGQTLKHSRPSEDEMKQNSQWVFQPETAQSDGLVRFSNSSQSKGVAAVDGAQGNVVTSNRNGISADGEMRDREEQLQQVSSSRDIPTGRRPGFPATGRENPAGTYEHQAADVSSYAGGQNPIDSRGKSVVRLTEGNHRGQPVSANRKVDTEAGNLGKDGEKLAAEDEVSERGHLLLSSMVDKNDDSKHPDGSHPGYPAVGSGRNPEPKENRMYNPIGTKDGGNYRKVQAHPKPVYGSGDKTAASSEDQNPQQPVAESQYPSSTDTRRLRKPDLGRVNPRPSDAQWQPSEKSSTYRYDLDSHGKYPNYAKPNTRPNARGPEVPSSGQFPADRESHLGKNYVRGSAGSSGSGRDSGPGRAGLTEARHGNPAMGKNQDQVSDSRGFLSNRPLGSQYSTSQFRSRNYNSGHGLEAPTSYEGPPRRTGLVGDRSRYPSNSQSPSNGQYPGNSRDVLYDESFYPASDDYYYADGLGGPPGRAAGYDSQAPVDYDYYHMAAGTLSHHCSVQCK